MLRKRPQDDATINPLGNPTGNPSGRPVGNAGHDLAAPGFDPWAWIDLWIWSPQPPRHPVPAQDTGDDPCLAIRLRGNPGLPLGPGTEAVAVLPPGADAAPGPVPDPGQAAPVAVPEAPALAAAVLPVDLLSAQQWHLTKVGAGINVIGAWADYTGRGVRIGIIDEGVERGHADLGGNYRVDLDWDFVSQDADAAPGAAGESHGTAVAGVIAAENNGFGVVGVAFNAGIAGLRIGYGAGASLDQIGGAFARAAASLDVVNASWGFGGFFGDNFGTRAFAPLGQALEEAARAGRDGRGTTIVFAAGNERASGQNTNYHDFQNSPHVVTVGATDRSGAVTGFSTPGATILVAAPGSAIVTTDRSGAGGYAGGDIAAVSGTSFAAPIVAGVVALMLEANPALGYRDVQEILAYSAVDPARSDPTGVNRATDWNGGGLTFNDDIGFGLVDARAAVRLAESWTQHASFANAAHLISPTPSRAVPIADAATVTSTLVLATADPFKTDRVEVTLNLVHASLSDLVIALVSPLGTESLLVNRPGTINGVKVATTPTALTMQLDSVQFWGEDPNGTWTLRVTDTARGSSGQLLSWQLDIIGDRGADDTYVFTDAYASLGRDPARRVLADADGGVDTLNLAALTAAAVVDLRPGEASSIAGRRLILDEDSVIEQVFGGDGADTITGNDAGNRIAGGRGADLLAGGPGADVFLFQRLEDAGDRILDFGEEDRLGLGGLLATLGYRGITPLADGWLLAQADGPGTALMIDPDGPGGDAPMHLATLEGFRGALTEAQLLA